MANTMLKAGLLLALLMVSAGACGNANTVLQVNFDPTDVGTVTLLASQVVIGGESRTMDIKSPDSQPISLATGTSYTLEIPHQYSGAVQVFVAGLDAKGTVVLSGTGSRGPLNVGTFNDVEVVWQASP
jgi:hypothetical protein